MKAPVASLLTLGEWICALVVASALAIVALAALTLLPYLGPLSRAREWNVIMQAPVDLAWLVERLRAATGADTPALPALACGLALALLAACASCGGPGASGRPVGSRLCARCAPRVPPPRSRSFSLAPVLSYLSGIRAISWWPRAESNRRHCDFQSHALPTELPGHAAAQSSPDRGRGPRADLEAGATEDIVASGSRAATTVSSPRESLRPLR